MGLVVVTGGPSDDGGPAGLQKTEIVWSAPTNGWPESLWVYKVVRQEFSPAVISNLLALSGFTMKDRTNMLDEPPFEDKTILYFRNADQSKYLGIFPALGWIDYNDRRAEAASHLDPVRGVPNEKEATQLGLKYLRLVGIDIAQIATKPGTDELDLHWEKETIGYVDQGTKKEITLTNRYGVFFNRRIDGINVGGVGLWGGARISFGNDAKVVDLQVCWRNLKPYELRPFPSPAEITKWLRSGQIPLRPTVVGATVGRLAEQIQKLTITKATPLYDGKYQDEMMDFVFPYVRFEAVGDDRLGTTALWFEWLMRAPKVQSK